jgi:pimeloyl-[acyl-carrier protein] methyl ester esterase
VPAASPPQPRPPIVAIPGWSCGSGAWNRLLPAIGHAVVSHAGIGSARVADELLSTVLAALGAEPAVLFGSSLGAMLAIEAAAEAGDRVRALVLVGGTLRFTCDDRKRGWPSRAVERMARRLAEDPPGTVERFQMAMFAPGEEPEARAFCHEPACRDGWTMEGLVAGLEYLLATDLTGCVRDLTCPVLWVHGDADGICPPGATAAMGDRHARVVIPTAGHLPAWTRPREVADVVQRFIADA